MIERDNSSRMIDLTGLRFGRRTIHWPVGRHKRKIMWLSSCDCGKLSLVVAQSLRSGGSSQCISCGLRFRASNRDTKNSPEYKMWTSAKCRAKKAHLPFDISVSDIKIPEFCPLLDVLLQRSKGKSNWNSPTLDRKIPALGYVKGNVWVVSRRANAIKNDATIEDFEKVLQNWKNNL